MASTRIKHAWGRNLVLAAICAYGLLAILVIAQNPGLQYDEALLVLGSVHMRVSPGELTLPHDPYTWACLRGHCLPLMTVRYVGALKEYLCLPLFRLFGSTAYVLRAANMFLGAIGILGLALLAGQIAGWRAAAVTAWAIAINPAYLGMTIFDNGTVAIWMFALGVLSVAVAVYARSETIRSAFLLGIAMGLGIWARANFIWMLIAMAAAAAWVLGRNLVRPASHWVALAAGGILGGFPFLVYQVISKGGSWEATDMFVAPGSLSNRLLTRLVMLSETLITDREHRVMWNGPAMPVWQVWLFSCVVLLCCGICLKGSANKQLSGWGKAVAAVFVLLSGFLFLTRLPVSEHHLIALLPVAAVVVALAHEIVPARWSKVALAILASVYLGVVCQWHVLMIDGLRRTGGMGVWSDAVFGLAKEIERDHEAHEIKILDWGLQNNLYILTGGRLRSRELFADSTPAKSGDGRPWMEEVRIGGRFLLNGPENRQIPDASVAFLRVLEENGPVVHRTPFRQRDGRVYAEMIDVDPNSFSIPGIDRRCAVRGSS